MPPWYVRIWCDVLGHRWRANRRGAPVTEFMQCIRCGKLGERLG